jgi:hypothetical protein
MISPTNSYDAIYLTPMFFNTSEEIDDYARAREYRKANPGFCLGVVMDKNAKGDYEYTIRYNASGSVSVPDTKKPRYDPVEK